jgi:hypothetical protein
MDERWTRSERTAHSGAGYTQQVRDVLLRHQGSIIEWIDHPKPPMAAK